MKSQSTFSERLARIESQTTIGGADAYVSDKLVHEEKRQRRLHWDMLAGGGLAGGIIGAFFAMKVGLLLVASLDATTLYQFILADYTMALLILGVAAAPFGFVMSQIFAFFSNMELQGQTHEKV